MPSLRISCQRGKVLAAARRVSANAITLTGLAIGLLVLPSLAYQQYEAALVVILANRLCDGLDGAVARLTRPTDSASGSGSPRAFAGRTTAKISLDVLPK